MEQKGASDLLFADLQHFGESLWRNEEIGEKRFNFFLTFATAVLAGVVAAHTSPDLADDLSLLRQLASVAVLILGGWTFMRMLKRDRITDEHKATLKYLRGLLAGQLCPHIPEYQVPYRQKAHPDRRREGRWRPSGGLAETVAVVNGLVSVLMLYSFSEDWGLAVMIGGAVLGIQFVFVSRRETPSVHPDQHFRVGVGAVVLGPEGKVLAFERSGAAEWQLPQGGLQIGENPKAAVWRELKEETGLTEDDVEFVTEYPRPLGYELPEGDRSRRNGRGQVHFWFYFKATRADLLRRVNEGPELGPPDWLSFETLIDRAIWFKKDVYRALSEFEAEECLAETQVAPGSV